MLSKRIFVVVLVLCCSGAAWATNFLDAGQITVTAAVQRSDWAGFAPAINLINGSGLQPDLTVNNNSADTYGYLERSDYGQNLWTPDGQTWLGYNYSPTGLVDDAWVAFTFSTPQAINKMWVWNYNSSAYPARDWKTVAIDYSTDGTTWTRLGGSSHYFTFAQSPGASGYVCNNKINFGGIIVKKVVLSLASNGNYGAGAGYSGLSEVRFETGVPPNEATSPTPADNAVVTGTTVLSWAAGNSAVAHNVYFGQNSTAVQNAVPLPGDINGSGHVDWNDLEILTEQWLSSPLANSTYWADISDDDYVSFYDFAKVAEDWLKSGDGIYKGHYPLNACSYNPGILESGATYYWRIDEVNSSTVWPGSVWSFITALNGPNIAITTLGAIPLPSSQSTDWDPNVENIIDSNTNTYWKSDIGTFPNWVEIRWPQPVYANRVVIDEKAGYLSATYRVDVFRVDTNTWQTVVGPKTNQNPGSTINENFSTTEVAKVRFYPLTGYGGATQSGITSMQIFGSRDWLEACKLGLPPYKPDPASFPAVSGSANYTCTSFSANPAAVVPGSKVQINLQLRKTSTDATNYGFQVRIGELWLGNTTVVPYPCDYTVAVSEINPSTPTSQWVIGQDYPLSVSVYIPQWAPHGNISVIVTPLCASSRGAVTNVTNNIVGTFKIQRFATDPVPWPAVVPTTTVAIENDQANLYVNGNLVSPYIMTLPEYTTYQSMGEQTVSNCQIWRIMTLKNLTADYNTPAGDAENAQCFADFDQKINNLLKVDPNAYIYPYFGIRPTGWTARWPNEATIMSNGTVPYSYSLSSPQFARQIDYDYRALVAHIMSQSYSGHVIGIQFEMAKETTYWGFLANSQTNVDRTHMALGDYSPCHIAAFRTWLQNKYVTEAALQAAWHSSNVTFANAYPTASILRRLDSTLMFKDPNASGAGRMPMDYWEFHAEEMANMAIVAAKAIKEASGNKYITGLWGFYSSGTMTAWNAPGLTVHVGYTALQKAMASPYIDSLTGIQAYTLRRWGQPMITEQLLDSVRRNGKLPLVEFDVRTFFVSPSVGSNTFSEPETISVLYDYAWGAALKGNALWWVGFSAGATGSTRASVPWFASNSINDALVTGKTWYDAIRSTPSPSNAEVAVFFSNSDICAMDAYDGYKVLVSAQYQTLFFELTKLGTPIDYYELDDINKPFMNQNNYKVYVFLNAYNLTTAQRNAIKAVVRQTGKTAVWLYGAGYNNGSTNAAANVQDMTGMVTTVTLERRLPVVYFLSGHTLTANITPTGPTGYTLQPHPWEYDSNPSAYTIGPIFDVDSDATVEQLGKYIHNNKVAYATKIVGNGRSIFMAIPYMSSVVLRDICRVAGVSLYSQNDLYLDADQHFILITNGSTAFNGNITLPQSSQVYDLWNKSIVGNGTSFTASIPANVSRMYFYGTSAEVTAFRAKIE